MLGFGACEFNGGAGFPDSSPMRQVNGTTAPLGEFANPVHDGLREPQVYHSTRYQPTGLFINNQFVKSVSGGTLTSISPIDEEEIATIEAASAADVDIAVAAARAAFEDASWSDLDSTARGRLIYRLADLVEQECELLASIDTWDNGKRFKSALGDIEEVVGVLRYYAGFADKIHGETIQTGPDKLAYTIREPFGVCAQIIPWNYPLAMLAWKIAPALATGNTIVLKPAEQTPLSALVFATLLDKAGYPPGVLNILNGFGQEAGAALASHMGVDKIAFTGSTVTARTVMKLASTNLKSLTLETGGKSPLVVFDDADVSNALFYAHYGVMANQGQICTSTSRIFVHEKIFDSFLEQFLERVRTISIVGDPYRQDTFQGPQVSRAQYNKILAYVESGKSDGAELVSGGGALANKPGGKGFYVQPTVFKGVTSAMRIFKEEIFGPFAVFVRFTDEGEVLEMANDSEYGLSAAVFTENLKRAHRFARKLQAGMVWINFSQDSDYRIPFGGNKQSGIGRELGAAGLAAYTAPKSVHVKLL